MTKPRSRFTAFLLLIGFLFLGASSATAAIPFLIWERGKTQDIVLGGETTSADWNIFLVDAANKSYPFKKSSPNPKKYIVYSIDLPKDFPKGSYQVEARSNNGDKSSVAGVSVIERTYYTITSIPGDLRTLFIFFALFTATFSVMRSRKYSALSYNRTLRFKDEESENPARTRVPSFIQPLYKFRQRREANMEISLLRFVMHRDGEVLHKLSPITWALLPAISFIGGLAIAFRMQGHQILPLMPVAIYCGFTIIGLLDAFSGITGAVGLFVAQLAFGDITSVRAFLLFFAFVAPWFVTTLLGSLYYMMLRIDVWSLLKNASNGVRTFVTLTLVAFLGGASVYAVEVALQSMSVQAPVPSFFFLPLSCIAGVALFVKNYMDFLLDNRLINKESVVTTKVEKLTVARVLSPGTSLVILLGVLGIAFVWTQSMVMALVVAVLASLAFIFLYLSFPYQFFARIPLLPRNILLEALIIATATYGAFFALDGLPISVIQKSKTFILLALIPMLVHGLYSLLEDSSDRARTVAKGVQEE